MKEFTGYQHGINLGGWLSQCDHTKERYDTFITEEDIERIKGWGLDHIRIPVDYDLVEEKDGTYREEGFGYIQKAIDWAGKYELNMILDLHKTFPPGSGWRPCSSPRGPTGRRTGPGSTGSWAPACGTRFSSAFRWAPG